MGRDRRGTASVGRVKTENVLSPSPRALSMRPPAAVTASSIVASCSCSAGDIAVASRSHNGVDDSMSVRRKVTTPVGSVPLPDCTHGAYSWFGSHRRRRAQEKATTATTFQLDFTGSGLRRRQTPRNRDPPDGDPCRQAPTPSLVNPARRRSRPDRDEWRFTLLRSVARRDDNYAPCARRRLARMLDLRRLAQRSSCDVLQAGGRGFEPRSAHGRGRLRCECGPTPTTSSSASCCSASRRLEWRVLPPSHVRHLVGRHTGIVVPNSSLPARANAVHDVDLSPCRSRRTIGVLIIPA